MTVEVEHPCAVLSPDGTVLLIATNQKVAYTVAVDLSMRGTDVYGYRLAESDDLYDMMRRLKV